jgi:hypothetical protein
MHESTVNPTAEAKKAAARGKRGLARTWRDLAKLEATKVLFQADHALALIDARGRATRVVGMFCQRTCRDAARLINSTPDDRRRKEFRHMRAVVVPCIMRSEGMMVPAEAR